MPKWTYDTLVKNMKEYTCTLLTTRETYTGTSKVKWKCICGDVLTSTYKELVRWQGKCKSCRKIDYKPIGGKKLTYTYDTVYQIFDEAGCKLLTDERHYRGPRIAVDWECSCGERQKSSFNSFRHAKRCRLCGWKASGGITFEMFRDVLESHEWEMIGKKHEYKNSKSMMTVRTNTGGITSTSYNRFQQGHRSKEEADESCKKDFEEVEELFNGKGFKLLDVHYVNNSTLMEYECRCGKTAEITYNCLKKNIIGCFVCSNSKRIGDNLCLWEENGAYYLRAMCGNKLKKYKFPSGKEIEVQGYEPNCLDELLCDGVEEDDITTGFDNVPIIQYFWKGHYHSYYPDIHIKSENRIIEVKSPLTFSYEIDKNRKKWQAVAQEGYLMEIYVYKGKRKLEKHTYKPYRKTPIIEKFEGRTKLRKVKKQIKRDLRQAERMSEDEIEEAEIDGWPGCIVTNDGRVFGNHKKEYVRFLSQNVVKVQLEAKIDGKWRRHRCRIDYLVLKHFLPENQRDKVDDLYYTIVHLNDDPNDNRLSNLKLERKEDVNEIKFVRDTVGKGVQQFSMDRELIAEYESTFDASKKTGISTNNIKESCRGNRKGAGGFLWEYIEILKPDPNQMNIDQWRIIPEFQGYKISRKGVIWSIGSNQLISPYGNDGYLKVKLAKNGKRHTQSVHLLVARTYLPAPDMENMKIRHRNMNTQDNSIGNLEWIGYRAMVTNKSNCKAVVQYDIEEVEMKKYSSLKEASEGSGAHPDAITKVCNSKRKTAGGYKWKWKWKWQ